LAFGANAESPEIVIVAVPACGVPRSDWRPAPASDWLVNVVVENVIDDVPPAGVAGPAPASVAIDVVTVPLLIVSVPSDGMMNWKTSELELPGVTLTVCSGFRRVADTVVAPPSPVRFNVKGRFVPGVIPGTPHPGDRKKVYWPTGNAVDWVGAEVIDWHAELVTAPASFVPTRERKSPVGTE
jgi:hypothetical protein